MTKITFLTLPINICPELTTFHVDIADEEGKNHKLGMLTADTELVYELLMLLTLGGRRAGVATEIKEFKPWTSSAD